MRPKLIVGNWKMYTNSAEAARLAKSIAAGINDKDRVAVAICPPFPYLALVGETLRVSLVALGAQNLFPANQGAFTGEVSPTMLLDLGCRFVILGHSERRHKMGESDAFINQKVLFAVAAGLEVILCVGETFKQRNAKKTEVIIVDQLTHGLAGLSANFLARVNIAYEPVWAIGNHGHHATPEQAYEEHAVIRERFGQMFDAASAQRLRILYGGSVNPENAPAMLAQPGVDGALIGADSLNAGQFLAIIQAGAAAPKTSWKAA